MSLRLHRTRAPHDATGDDEQPSPRRLDLDALLIPFQRPAPAAEPSSEQPGKP